MYRCEDFTWTPATITQIFFKNKLPAYKKGEEEGAKEIKRDEEDRTARDNRSDKAMLQI